MAGAYSEMYEALLGGARFTVRGVKPESLKRQLYTAKQALEEAAQAEGLRGFKLPPKHIVCTEPDLDGQYDVYFTDPRPSGFGKKLQIVGMQPSPQETDNGTD